MVLTSPLISIVASIRVARPGRATGVVYDAVGAKLGERAMSGAFVWLASLSVDLSGPTRSPELAGRVGRFCHCDVDVRREVDYTLRRN